MTTFEKIVLFSWLLMIAMFALWAVAAIFADTSGKTKFAEWFGKAIAIYAAACALAATFAAAEQIWRS